MNHTQKLVSVVVPAYNVERYITRCLDSISRQDYSRMEIIVINDGSTDDTLHLIQRAAEKDARIRAISQQNAGVSAARNRGLQACHGDYVVWVDADDYIAPTLVRKVMETFSETHADAVVIGYSTFGSRKGAEITLPPVGLSAATWRKKAIMDEISMVWNFAAAKDMWRDVSFPIERTHMSEDAAASIDVFLKVGKVAAIPEVLYFYNKENPQALTAQVNTDVYYDQLEDALMRETLCQEYCPEERPFFLRRILSFGVKSYAFGLHDPAFTGVQKEHVVEVLRTRDFSPVPGRLRDKFLRWCLLHGLDVVCRQYGAYKYKKMVHKKRRQ